VPGVGPAVAQVTLPPDFISPNVPHDVPAGPSATVQDLAIFAWQEFIALNWTAMNPATPPNVRGRPANVTDPKAGFLDIAPDGSGNFPLVVWHTYRHKNELFPYQASADPSFDSAIPTYKYQPPVPTAAISGPVPSFNLFNNLDETSQIGLCNMYAHATNLQTNPELPPILVPGTGIRVAYEAKVNRALFDYANQQGFLNANGAALGNALANTSGNLAKFGGICSPPTGVSPSSIVMLPCGDNSVTGDAGEGAIEIKAAWRKLTPDELSSGRFFTRNVLFYTGSQAQGQQTFNNAVWGLVALHIIHKTKSFPAFVFATWEQVDNYDDGLSDNPNRENLAFQNTGTPLPNIPVVRAHPIHSQVAPVNDVVHAAFTDPTTGNPNTVWQYYKLIGVQATPVNFPPANASSDDLSYYFLANIMVETNQTLQNFTGGAPKGVPIQGFTNVNVAGLNNGQPFSMGGCQGCHGFQAQQIGGDMSRLLAVNSSNTSVAESIDVGVERSVTTYRLRSQDAVLMKGLPLPKGVSRGQVRHGTTYPKCCR